MDANFNSSIAETFLGNNSRESSSVEEYDYAISYEEPECPENSPLLVFRHFSDEWIETFLYSKIDKVMISIIYPVIVALGLVTNVAFLFTLLRVRQMRTITNFYLANLAISDLSFVILTAVVYFYKYTWSPDFKRGDPWATTVQCAATNSTVYTPYFASILLVTLVSVERFLAICFPLKHRIVNNKSRTVKMVLATWLTAFAFTAVVAPNYAAHKTYCIAWPDKWQHRLPTVFNYCNSVNWRFIDIASICQFAPFILALILNTILYILIILRLSKRDVGGKGDDKAGLNSQAQKVRNSVARMLVINGIAYFLCLAPYQFYNMYFFAIRKCTGDCALLDAKYVNIIGWIGRVTNVLNSAINPIIYNVTNSRYRQAFYAAIGCVNQKRNASEMSGAGTTRSSNPVMMNSEKTM